ncbi:MAG: hypothetical protein IT522_17910 [Burkholderiales bacterium]|nr:hypothetical protein [Burkholderiales bacterium]
MLDAPETSQTPEAQAESREAVRQRRLRYIVEMELRLAALHAERDVLYAERHAQRINDETLRARLASRDRTDVARSLRQR